MTDLLTINDIADMYKCSLRHARERVVRHPGFPAPVPTSTPRNRRWMKVHVLRYLSGKTTH